MKAVFSLSITKILPIVLLILSSFVIYKLFIQKVIKAPVESLGMEEDISDVASKVKSIWEAGDIDSLDSDQRQKCTDIPFFDTDFPKSFYECNPSFLNCYLSQKKIKDSIRYLRLRRNLAQKGRIILDFEFKNRKKGFSIQIRPYCLESYLPQKVYLAGPDQNKDYIWDNYGRDYFIDQLYINHYQRRFWQTGKKKIVAGDYLPILDLSMEEMKKTCHSMGKFLMLSHLLDAGTFYPSRINQSGYLFKSKFPWSKRGDDISQRKLRNNVSWIGLHHGLGGYSEAVRNDFLVKANLKLSSYKRDIESLWHRLGLRGYWSGEGLKKNDFELIEQYSGRNLGGYTPTGVAFRCAHLK